MPVPGWGLRNRLKIEPERLPLGARSVVAEEEDERVLHFAMSAKIVDKPADISIHTRHHTGVNGHPLGQISATVLRQRIPGRIVAIGGDRAVATRDLRQRDRTARRQGKVTCEEPERLLPCLSRFADLVPSLGVHFAVALHVAGPRRKGEMGRLIGNVEEPGRRHAGGLRQGNR